MKKFSKILLCLVLVFLAIFTASSASAVEEITFSRSSYSAFSTTFTKITDIEVEGNKQFITSDNKLYLIQNGTQTSLSTGYVSSGYRLSKNDTNLFSLSIVNAVRFIYCYDLETNSYVFADNSFPTYEDPLVDIFASKYYVFVATTNAIYQYKIASLGLTEEVLFYETNNDIEAIAGTFDEENFELFVVETQNRASQIKMIDPNKTVTNVSFSELATATVLAFDVTPDYYALALSSKTVIINRETNERQYVEYSAGNLSARKGEITMPFAIDVEDGVVYIADRSNSIQGFSLTNSLRNTFSLYNASEETGYYFQPSDIYVGNTAYIADTGNMRVACISGSITTYLNLQTSGYYPLLVEGAPSNNMYYVAVTSTKGNAQANTVLVVQGGIIKKKLEGYTSISDIQCDINGNLYIADEGANRIYKLEKDTYAETVYEFASPKCVATNPINSSIFYVLSNGTVYRVYRGEPTQIFFVHQMNLPYFKKMAIDYEDNVICLYTTQTTSTIYYYSKEDAYTTTEYHTTNALFNSMYMSPNSGYFYFTDRDNNKIYISNALNGQIKIIDVPVVAPYVELTQGEALSSPVAIATVVSYPSSILYPVDEKYEKNKLYPKDYMNDDQINIDLNGSGTDVLVLGGTNLDYLFVVYNGRVGFIINNIGSVNIKQNTTLNLSAKVLHENTLLYKVPTFSEPFEGAYALQKLSKNESLTIVSNVADYTENGIQWYEVLYKGQIGYIPRFNVSVVDEVVLEETTKAVIDTKNVSELVNVYKGKDYSSDVVTTLHNGFEVDVITYNPNDWCYIRVDTGNEIVRGYIKAEDLSLGGLSGGQIVGVILISLVVIGGTVTFFIIRKKKKDALIAPKEN